MQSLQSTDCRLCLLPKPRFSRCRPLALARGTSLLPIVIMYKSSPVVFCEKPLLNHGPFVCYT